MFGISDILGEQENSKYICILGLDFSKDFYINARSVNREHYNSGSSLLQPCVVDF